MGWERERRGCVGSLMRRVEDSMRVEGNEWEGEDRGIIYSWLRAWLE